MFYTTAVRLHVFLFLVNSIEQELKIQWEYLSDRKSFAKLSSKWSWKWAPFKHCLPTLCIPPIIVSTICFFPGQYNQWLCRLGPLLSRPTLRWSDESKLQVQCERSRWPRRVPSWSTNSTEQQMYSFLWSLSEDQRVADTRCVTHRCSRKWRKCRFWVFSCD